MDDDYYSGQENQDVLDDAGQINNAAQNAYDNYNRIKDTADNIKKIRDANKAVVTADGAAKATGTVSATGTLGAAGSTAGSNATLGAAGAAAGGGAASAGGAAAAGGTAAGGTAAGGGAASAGGAAAGAAAGTGCLIVVGIAAIAFIFFVVFFFVFNVIDYISQSEGNGTTGNDSNVGLVLSEEQYGFMTTWDKFADGLESFGYSILHPIQASEAENIRQALENRKIPQIEIPEDDSEDAGEKYRYEKGINSLMITLDQAFRTGWTRTLATAKIRAKKIKPVMDGSTEQIVDTYDDTVLWDEYKDFWNRPEKWKNTDNYVKADEFVPEPGVEYVGRWTGPSTVAAAIIKIPDLEVPPYALMALRVIAFQNALEQTWVEDATGEKHHLVLDYSDDAQTNPDLKKTTQYQLLKLADTLGARGIQYQDLDDPMHLQEAMSIYVISTSTKINEQPHFVDVQQKILTGYEQKIVGYEQKIVDYEKKIVGYEQKFIGYEKKLVGYEQKIVRYETTINGIIPIYGDDKTKPIYEENKNKPLYGDDLTRPIYDKDPSRPIYGDDTDSPIKVDDLEKPIYKYEYDHTEVWVSAIAETTYDVKVKSNAESMMLEQIKYQMNTEEEKNAFTATVEPRTYREGTPPSLYQVQLDILKSLFPVPITDNTDNGGWWTGGESEGFIPVDVGFAWPLPQNPTVGHWSRGFTADHKGIDWAAPEGTPIFAAADGVVERAKWHNSWGYHVRILHNSGASNGLRTNYAHMVQPPSVFPGQEVKQGQLIGYVGNTGNSFGNHLHLEVWGGGSSSTRTDPSRYFPIPN